MLLRSEGSPTTKLFAFRWLLRHSGLFETEIGVSNVCVLHEHSPPCNAYAVDIVIDIPTLNLLLHIYLSLKFQIEQLLVGTEFTCSGIDFIMIIVLYHDYCTI